jgi:signal transduction histidine kinase
MPRAAPLLVAVGIAALVVSYVAYTQRVMVELQREGNRTATMFARVYSALNDTTPDASMRALLDLSRSIDEMGVPVVITDDAGIPTVSQNLPFDPVVEPDRLRDLIADLDRQNPPVPVLLPVQGGQPRSGAVHYGSTPMVRWLRIIPWVQAAVLAVLIAATIALLRARGRADREKMWAGMARESAHQLGTPLSSLSGWIELLAEEAGESTMTALTHMRGDLERLGRVAHRFERIGRPPKREAVDVAALAERVSGYFRARVPTLAHTVLIRFVREDSRALTVQGDPVLLEWALESLIKNAVDALAGRGGTITVTADHAAESGARIRVSDDGPGIPLELRRDIFRAGFSTKSGGWGIGLSLARRIVEENHGGSLALVSAGGPGATFEIILR